MEATKCRTCQHFRQHYILDNQSCRAINCPHCTKSHLKHRRPGQTACPHYTPCPNSALPNRREVIRFLTTDFLQYILQLELPPEKIL